MLTLLKEQGREGYEYAAISLVVVDMENTNERRIRRKNNH